MSSGGGKGRILVRAVAGRASALAAGYCTGTRTLPAGDMVLFPLAAANRDPAVLSRAREVVIEREPGPHYAFGAGPHRCLGSQLARLEMSIALGEWHAVIPDYHLDTTEPILEHRGSVHGLQSLPLRW